jgi:hypothetical protein
LIVVPIGIVIVVGEEACVLYVCRRQKEHDALRIVPDISRYVSDRADPLSASLVDEDHFEIGNPVVAIVAFVDVPLVYFCVRWWRSLHQIQSSPATVSSSMVLPLRINAIAMLLIAIWMITQRTRIELARRAAEEAPEPDPLPIKEDKDD